MSADPPESDAIALAMTGASGALYGLRLLECLIAAGKTVYLMVSAPALVVIAEETDLRLPGRPAEMQGYLAERYQATPGQLHVLARDQWHSPPASGSSAPRAMVVCPCTSGTLSAIANGASDNLIERAADVALKEQRKLILVVREMPLSAIHLENMLKLARLGALILPASPGFYHQPRGISDLVDFVVARVLDHLGIRQSLVPPWAEDGAL
ncbi:MAG: UbiX family flavin prenyltransferase [Gammaproteobacteria bacterium]|nr:UbiX family flavin prenyltransferase [Gammaproteobacteria bacterium]